MFSLKNMAVNHVNENQQYGVGAVTEHINSLGVDFNEGGKPEWSNYASLTHQSVQHGVLDGHAFRS